jgi:hypothetical protein
VRDKHVALFVREFVNSGFERVEQHVARILGVRARIRRRQQILERLAHGFRLPFSKQIGDPITRDAKEPRGHVLDGHQQTVRLDELVEHVLQNIFGVARIRHAPADEAAQPRLLAVHDLGDPPILFAVHPLLV